jgi:hypothetical protein
MGAAILWTALNYDVKLRIVPWNPGETFDADTLALLASF